MRTGCCRCFVPAIAVFLVCPFLLPCFCKNDNTLIKNWNDALICWQNDFNSECLEPLGMLVKTQSNCWVTYDEKGGKQRHFERWIAFALTPENAMRLKHEPHLIGDIDDCCATCCGAYPESKCCVHPRG